MRVFNYCRVVFGCLDELENPMTLVTYRSLQTGKIEQMGIAMCGNKSMQDQEPTAAINLR